jgi:hypothetical protein
MQMFLLGVIVTLTPSILTLAWLLWRVEGAQELRFDPERKYSRALDDRGPRKIAIAGNRGHRWGEQHRIETRTKRNHSRVNSGRLTIGGNYSRSPIESRCNG